MPMNEESFMAVLLFFVDVLRWSDGNPSHRRREDKPEYPAPEHRVILCEAGAPHN
jgi:hypothetical protein